MSIALKTDKLVEIEYSLSIKDEINYFEARFLKLDDGVVTCIVRDITKRKKKDIAIQQNQILLNSILDNLPFLVILKDVKDDFRYIYWNSECDKQSGFRVFR